jgi:hypothetical protein
VPTATDYCGGLLFEHLEISVMGNNRELQRWEKRKVAPGHRCLGMALG